MAMAALVLLVASGASAIKSLSYGDSLTAGQYHCGPAGPTPSSR